MTLVRHAAWKRVARDGSDKSVITPGASPPAVVPYCSLCSQPCETFWYDVATSFWRMGIHAECCGRQQSRWLSLEELRMARLTNAKVFVIAARGRRQETRRL